MSTPILVIVQARMASTRLPEKVLLPLLGQPMLLWQLERVSRMTTPHTLVVATPDAAENRPIVALCERHGYACETVPGEAWDVLGRFQWVAERYEADLIVRLTGDCPLLDPDVVDRLITTHMMQPQRPDHTGIATEWGDGQDCEVMSRNALELAAFEATSRSDREHVTPYLWRHPQRFRCTTMACPFDLHEYQYSVDTQADLMLCEDMLRKLFLHGSGLDFGWQDIMATVLRYPLLLQRMRGRGARNRAYLEQVAREDGMPMASWDTKRYQA